MGTEGHPDRFHQVAAVAGAALILCALSFAYGRTFIYHDSGTYYMYGQHIVSELDALYKQTQNAVIPMGEVERDYVGARSPSYSLLTFVLTSKLSLWGLGIAQAVVAAWSLLLAARCIAPARPLGVFAALIAGLTLASSLPYFATFAMPDVFGGIGFLALALLTIWRDSLGRTERIGLWLLVAASASFHPTFPPVFAAALLAAAAVQWLLRRRGLRIPLSLLPVVTATVVGGLVPSLYNAAERFILQQPVYAPPFLMARLLEDGPALSYVEDRCAADPSSFALCRVPLTKPVDSDVFLWAEPDQGGTYKAIDPTTRAELRAEERRLLLGTLLAMPLQQAGASIRNAWRQILTFSVVEPIDDPRTQASYNLFEMVHARPGEARTLAAEPVLAALRTVALVASSLWLAYFTLTVVRNPSTGPDRWRLVVLIGILVVVLLGNAALCGAVSKPYPRYQARLIWLVPALAILTLAHQTNRAAPGRTNRFAADGELRRDKVRELSG